MTINSPWVPGLTLEEIERQSILHALTFYRGNKTQTATALGIAIRTLDNKLERYGADDEAGRLKLEAERARRAEILDRMRGPIQTIYGADARVRVEPAPEAPAKHAVPVPEPKKVQGVLPPEAPAGDRKRAR